MKIKFKLSLLVIAIMAVVVTGISTLLLRQASAISVDLSKRSIGYLAVQRAEFWKGRENGYMRVLRTLADIMMDYENFPPEERRLRFDDMLLGVIAEEENMVSLYTVWKPNAIDNMDAQLIDRTGSSPTGQYAMSYTRENGKIYGRTSLDIEDSMAYINGPDSKRDRLENPVSRIINGKNKHLIRMMVPIINPHTNETVGGVGCLLAIDVIQTMMEQILQEHEEIAAMAIYAGNGLILANLYPDRVGKFLLDVEAGYGNAIEAANRAVLERKKFSTRQYVEDLDANLEIILEPFNIGTSNNGWTIMVASDDSYMLAGVRTMTKYTIILTIIALIAAAVIVFVILGYITKPIITVTETLKDISEGEGDLTHIIPVKGNDEIAALSRYFNMTLEKIKNLIITIKARTSILCETGNELANNMTETASAVNQIALSIQSIKECALNQSASVTETNATMKQITVNINKLNEHIELQTSSVSQSSSAVEGMLANIQTVTDTLISNGKNVNELSAVSEVGRAGLQNVADDVMKIAEESQGLLQINSVMQNIAAQTNLLSINAAIEAAHAGEAGKGFAVVAGEIRDLAESSAEQSKTISVILRKIKESIDNITESTAAVLTKFNAINDGVKTVLNHESNILDFMEEQDRDSKQIVEAIDQLNNITRQVGKGSAEMLEGSTEVIHEGKTLERVTEEITRQMNEMATGAEQINTAVNRVNDISIENKINIDHLVLEISRFKVE